MTEITRPYFLGRFYGIINVGPEERTLPGSPRSLRKIVMAVRKHEGPRVWSQPGLSIYQIVTRDSEGRIVQDTIATDEWISVAWLRAIFKSICKYMGGRETSPPWIPILKDKCGLPERLASVLEAALVLDGQRLLPASYFPVYAAFESLMVVPVLLETDTRMGSSVKNPVWFNGDFKPEPPKLFRGIAKVLINSWREFNSIDNPVSALIDVAIRAHRGGLWENIPQQSFGHIWRIALEKMGIWRRFPSMVSGLLEIASNPKTSAFLEIINKSVRAHSLDAEFSLDRLIAVDWNMVAKECQMAFGDLPFSSFRTAIGEYPRDEQGMVPRPPYNESQKSATVTSISPQSVDEQTVSNLQ